MELGSQQHGKDTQRIRNTSLLIPFSKFTFYVISFCKIVDHVFLWLSFVCIKTYYKKKLKIHFLDLKKRGSLFIRCRNHI